MNNRQLLQRIHYLIPVERIYIVLELTDLYSQRKDKTDRKKSQFN